MARSPKAYTPRREDVRDLDERTVGRTDVLDRLLHRFEIAATAGTLQHSLLVGPRGAGKSHVLEVALHRMSQRPELARRFTVAHLPEDLIGIAGYADLLVSIVQRIDAREATAAAARSHRRSGDDTTLERLITDHLADTVLVVVVENLNRLFDAIGEPGQRALRSWVETSRQILLLATSPLLIEAVTSRARPWYGSFLVEHLHGLGMEDATALVAHLADIRGGDKVAAYVQGAAGQARMETVQRLVAGSPRLWTIFADIVTMTTLDPLIPAVEDLLEDLVPYYQQRLWELPPNEQKIVLALAGLGHAHVPAKEVAERAGVNADSANVTLRRLEESGWVRSEKMAGTDQRATWYELREPLFRHYLQYRQGATDTISLIIELLQEWFEREALITRLLQAVPFSPDERHLAHSLLRERPPRFDAAYANGKPRDLILAARLWRHESSRALGPGAAATIIECVGIAAVHGLDRALEVLAGGDLGPEATDHVRDLLKTFSLTEMSTGETAGALEAISAAFQGDIVDVLALVSSCLRGRDDPPDALSRLRGLAATSGGASPRLRHAILTELGSFASTTGNHDEAIRTLERLTDGPDSVLALDDIDLLLSRVTLGVAYTAAGRHGDAVTLLEAVVGDLTRVREPDDPDTLAARGYLGSAYSEAGRPADAIAHLEALLDDLIRIKGPQHRDTFTTQGNLGSAYGEAGRPADAVALLEAVVDGLTTTFGPDDHDTIAARGNLGAIYVEAGRPTDAISLLEAVVKDRIREIGPHDPGTLTTRGHLGGAYFAAGRHAEAITLLGALVGDMTRVYPPGNPDTLVTRGNLAVAYNAAGRHDDAITLLEPLIADLTRINGPHHSETLTARGNLAVAYNAAGRHDDAITLLEPLIADLTRIIGPVRPNTLTARSVLGSAYNAAHRTTDAVTLLEPLVDERIRLLGPDHLDTLSSRGHLGAAYTDARRHQEAITLLEPLIADLTRIRGADHNDTLASRGRLGAAYTDARRHDDAITLFEALIADLSCLHEPEDPRTLITRGNLGVAYRSAGRCNDAITVLEPLIDDLSRILGPDQESALTSRGYLGAAFTDARRHDEAISVVEPLVKDLIRIHGQDHPDTRWAENILATAYLRLDRGADAVALVQPDRARGRGSDGILMLARERVRLGLRRGQTTFAGEATTLDLLAAVARDGDADAFARLPKEIRDVLSG